MNKKDAIKKAGGSGKLAKLLGISPGAVSLWVDDVIPDARIWQLKCIRPGWFRKEKATSKKLTA